VNDNVNFFIKIKSQGGNTLKNKRPKMKW
jgi:hypothetical protein